MAGNGNDIKRQRKSLGLSVEKLAQRANTSSASVKRAEADKENVTEDLRSRLFGALAEVAAERASLRLSSSPGAGGVADQLDRHALALMAIARRLRAGKVEDMADVVRVGPLKPEPATESGVAKPADRPASQGPGR